MGTGITTQGFGPQLQQVHYALGMEVWRAASLHRRHHQQGHHSDVTLEIAAETASSSPAGEACSLPQLKNSVRLYGGG